MIKRLFMLALAVMLIFSVSMTALACNEQQTETYILQILFGNNATAKGSDNNVKILLNALYVCSEQSDNQGQDKIEFLKQKGVPGIPSLNDLNIKGDYLIECSHNKWEYVFSTATNIQNNRKKVLQNAVNKIFDFGLINNWFGSGGGKCNSFAAILYYAHILSDYLADDPNESNLYYNGNSVSSFSGQPYTTINGNRPSFSNEERESAISYITYSSLDSVGRAGVVTGNIGPDIVSGVGERQNMVGIKPSGWNNFNRYDGIVNSQPAYLYNRCHLLAHLLGGQEQEINLITGTRYLNETGMLPFEEKVASYIRRTSNHVLYRVTPIYKGSNKLASGVQIEAYSVEDSGTGICFNVYCYNVQPGVEINYANGESQLADVTFGQEKVLPFAVYNANDGNPDLILEMIRHFEILFEDQKNSNTYSAFMNQINSIASEARAVGYHGENAAQSYALLKTYEYKFLEILKSYVPLLLEKEDFFSATFR